MRAVSPHFCNFDFQIGVTETLKQLFKSAQRRHMSNNGLNAMSSRLVTVKVKVNFIILFYLANYIV